MYLDWRKLCEKRRLCYTANMLPLSNYCTKQVVTENGLIICPNTMVLFQSSSTVTKSLTASVNLVEQ